MTEPEKRKKPFLVLIMTILTVSLIGCTPPLASEGNKATQIPPAETIQLPSPEHESDTSVEEALLSRRSVREYRDQPLGLAELTQLLWAAQGITDQNRGFRTAPSAGGLYPLELYVVIGDVEGVAPGIYKYRPPAHDLVRVGQGDVREQLSDVAVEQRWVEEGAAVIVFAAVYERTTEKYGDRGIRYVHMEVGHAAQNVYLQAVSLDLGTVFVGAFFDEDLKQLLHMEETETPLGIMPIGKK